MLSFLDLELTFKFLLLQLFQLKKLLALLFLTLGLLAPLLFGCGLGGVLFRSLLLLSILGRLLLGKAFFLVFALLGGFSEAHALHLLLGLLLSLLLSFLSLSGFSKG